MLEKWTAAAARGAGKQRDRAQRRDGQHERHERRAHEHPQHVEHAVSLDAERQVVPTVRSPSRSSHAVEIVRACARCDGAPSGLPPKDPREPPPPSGERGSSDLPRDPSTRRAGRRGSESDPLRNAPREVAGLRNRGEVRKQAGRRARRFLGSTQPRRTMPARAPRCPRSGPRSRRARARRATSTRSGPTSSRRKRASRAVSAAAALVGDELRRVAETELREDDAGGVAQVGGTIPRGRWWSGLRAHRMNARSALSLPGRRSRSASLSGGASARWFAICSIRNRREFEGLSV